MTPCWKRMSSGIYVDLANLSEKDLDIKDISNSLNNITRFTGHYKDIKPLTVAQHSYLCYYMGRLFEPDEKDLHLALLIHDFAEAYIGDVSTPVKKAMGDRWYSFSEPLEQLVEDCFFGGLVSPDMHQRVKMYDLAALDIERRVMWSSQFGKDKWPACPLNVGTISDKTELFNTVKNQEIDLENVWRESYELKK